MTFLVDTNVLSELARPAPDRGVHEWAGGLSEFAISVISVEEIRFGLSSKPKPRVAQWFDAFLLTHCEIHPVTESVADCSGQLRGQLQAMGKTRTQADMLIAATAAVHGLTLVTRNERDFDGCGIAVLNPFSG